MKKTLLIAVMSVFALTVSADSWESGVKIFGTFITSENVNDLMSLTNGQAYDGSMSYDNESGVLTLNGLKIDRKDVLPYFFTFTKTGTRKEYYVKINGQCIFDNKGTQKTILFADKDVTLIIDGTHGDPEKDGIDIYTGNGILGDKDAIIRIKNLTIEHNDIIFSMEGFGSSSLLSELSLINCNVTSNEETAIFRYMKDFKLIDCAFVTPADATFNSAKYQVESEGAALAHMPIEIKAKKTDIENVNQQSQIKNQKVIRDGHILIERNGELFKLTGGRVE